MLSSYTWSSIQEPKREVVAFKSCQSDSIFISRRLFNERLARTSSNPDSTEFKSSLEVLVENGIHPSYTAITKYNQCEIPWTTWPGSLHPAGGNVPLERQHRKLNQVENMINLAVPLIQSALARCEVNAPPSLKGQVKVVEFCAGSGYIVLPLAALFPQVNFVLLDKKSKSIEIARERIELSGLVNVEIVSDFLENYNDLFDVGLALHACGGASDAVLEKCLTARASFVICPCCIGKICLSRTVPLSAKFDDVLNTRSFVKLVQAADFGHSDLPNYSNIDRFRRISKCYVEEDRRQYAVSRGYGCELLVMNPSSASPKNEILFGFPLEKNFSAVLRQDTSDHDRHNASSNISGNNDRISDSESNHAVCVEKLLFGVCTNIFKVTSPGRQAATIVPIYPASAEESNANASSHSSQSFLLCNLCSQ